MLTDKITSLAIECLQNLDAIGNGQKTIPPKPEEVFSYQRNVFLGMFFDKCKEQKVCEAVIDILYRTDWSNIHVEKVYTNREKQKILFVVKQIMNYSEERRLK
jgi:hypothetical protein